MKKWKTEIYAISPLDGQQKSYSGPVIEADTIEEAEIYRENNGLGYCHILGELHASGVICEN